MNSKTHLNCQPVVLFLVLKT